MRMSKFRVYEVGIAVGLGIAVAVAITTDIPIIALAAVVIAIAAAIILERTNKEIIRDERISQISGKAASLSFYSVLILGAAISLVTAFFRNQLPENIVFFGTIMGYFVCVALLLHISFYAYFSREL